MTLAQVFNLLNLALKVSLVIFMVGSLLDMGLRLKLREALGGLQNVHFVVQSLLWGFVLCPALAYALTQVIPLDSPYAMGALSEQAAVGHGAGRLQRKQR